MTKTPESHPDSPPPASEDASSRVPRFSQVATGQAALDYDFNANRDPGPRTNLWESISHLIKSALGGGVVSIHEAYMQCGLWTALTLNVFLGMAVSYGMYILATSAQVAYGRTHTPTMSFPDLAEAVLDISHVPRLRRLSKVFRYVVDVTIIIDLFGSCCCYQCIMARSIKQLVEASDVISDSGNPPIRVYILGVLLPCILICMITKFKYLAPFSLVADMFIIIVAIATIVYGSQGATKSPTEYPAFKSVSGLFEFIGVCVFSMEGVGVTLPIENHMHNPRRISLVLVLGMSVIVSMVMTVGFFGYWGFGDKAKSPITLNFPFSTVTTTLKVSMVFMIYVTFALNFWVPFNLIWVYLKPNLKEERLWLTERLYRILFVFIITGISVAFPDVSKLMGVIGAFCLSNMGFIFPAFIDFCLCWEDPGLGKMKWRLWKFIAILLFGSVLMVYGTYTNFRELVKAVYNV